MHALKQSGKLIRNCVELYIPMAAFFVLFSVFCFQVFMRYVARNPQSWTMEVEQMCFLWLVLLGACYAQREKAHVTFTLIYDKMNVKGKAITALLGNLIITVTFLAATIPSFRYIMGQLTRAQVTSILKIEKAFIFIPYVVFLVIIVAYCIVEIYEEIMVLCGNSHYIEKMLAEGKSEAELAIEAAKTTESLNLNPDLTGGTELEGKE